MEYVLGFDLGTSYFKASLIDQQGRCLGMGRERTPKAYKGQEVLTDPRKFWEALGSCAGQAAEAAGVSLQGVRGISYGSQATSFLLADSQMRPLTDIILWPSFFTNEVYPEHRELFTRDDFLSSTGLGFHGGGLISTLLWMRRNRNDLLSSAARCMTISDYFLYGLTGISCADTSTSEILGILDVNTRQWWDPALDTLGVGKSFFGEPGRPMTLVGTTINDNPAGLPKGIPVFAGGIDHMVAAVGAGIGYAAEASESTGTVLACVSVREDYHPRMGICVSDYAAEGKYLYLAFESDGASVIEWYRDEYLPDMSIDDMLDLCDTVPHGAYGVTYVPEEGRLAFRGNTEAADHRVFIRSICEHLGRRTGLLLDTVGGARQLLATGRANQNAVLRKVKAREIGTRVCTTDQKEPGTFGAALVSAVGIGWFSSIQQAQESWITIDTVFGD